MLLTRKQMERVVPFLPVICSAGIVAASAATQSTPPPTQGSNEWLVIVGGLVTLLLEYQRRRMAENSKAIKVTQETTPMLDEFNALKAQVEKLIGNNSSMTIQIDMLTSDYKAVRIEREQAREDLKVETKAHDGTKQLLKDEQEVNAQLSRTIDSMETRIVDLERRIQIAESVNDLASKVIEGIKELVKKQTAEIEKVVSGPPSQVKPA